MLPAHSAIRSRAKIAALTLSSAKARKIADASKKSRDYRQRQRRLTPEKAKLGIIRMSVTEAVITTELG